MQCVDVLAKPLRHLRTAVCLSLCDVFYCRNCYWILSYLHLVKIYIDNKVYENNLNLRSSFWSRIMGDGQEMLGNLVSDCFYRKFFTCHPSERGAVESETI